MILRELFSLKLNKSLQNCTLIVMPVSRECKVQLLKIKYDVGNRSKFIAALFKTRSQLVKCYFRADKQVSRVRNICKIFMQLNLGA